MSFRGERVSVHMDPREPIEASIFWRGAAICRASAEISPDRKDVVVDRFGRCGTIAHHDS